MANIVIYSTSSVAVMKTQLLVDLLEKKGHKTTVLVSNNVEENVIDSNLIPYQLNRKISIDKNNKNYPAEHISLAKETDLVIVAPASLNLLSKFNYGISDEINLSFLLAFNGPIILAPAMNDSMWKSAIDRNIVDSLKKLPNVFIVGPEIGMLYEGYSAIGRMSEVSEIEKIASNILNKKSHPKILISYGASKVYIDKVRYITNGATGTLARKIESAFRKEGIVPDLINVENYNNEAIAKIAAGYDIYIASAAIANYKTNVLNYKLSTDADWHLKLTRDIDVIKTATNENPGLKVFAFKYDLDIQKAHKKIHDNPNIKAILYNKIGSMGNVLVDGALINHFKTVNFTQKTKDEIATMIVNEVLTWI
ncbi:flavoprotein [Mycoplasma testudineum]|nr:flavoprotein [Mycoplasma testudineum]